MSKTVKPIKRSMGERSRSKMRQKPDNSMRGRYDNQLNGHWDRKAHVFFNFSSTMVSPIITLGT